MRRHVVGLDVGSTYIKAMLTEIGGPEEGSAEGREVATARRATPWRSLPHGGADMAPEALLTEVTAVLAELGAIELPVEAIGVSGMAESGVLLAESDNVVGPVIAWFDPRGIEELRALPADLRADFPGRTGLPVGPLATFAKLWHRTRLDGLDLRGHQWLSVPEYVAWALGGARLSEVSLAARTGLLDQDTGQLWPDAAGVLGTDSRLLPPVTPAGSVWGHARGGLPATMREAVLTVAGHDHLVSSAACGVLDLDTLYDSMGTAEALVRVLDGVLDPEARGRLALHGVNVVRHMLPGHGVMLAGTKSGLLLRRVLQLVGITDERERELLDAQVMRLDALQSGAGGITISGATNDDGVLQIRTDADGLSPALLFEAALRHGSDVLTEVLGRMDAETAPATRTVVAGGWSRMQSVRRARRSLLPSPRFSERDEDTAYGAALVAAFAADPTEHDLKAYLARSCAPAAPRTDKKTPEGISG
jgi:sugar (pentulose or hexulose) kinase